MCVLWDQLTGGPIKPYDKYYNERQLQWATLD